MSNQDSRYIAGGVIAVAAMFHPVGWVGLAIMTVYMVAAYYQDKAKKESDARKKTEAELAIYQSKKIQRSSALVGKLSYDTVTGFQQAEGTRSAYLESEATKKEALNRFSYARSLKDRQDDFGNKYAEWSDLENKPTDMLLAKPDFLVFEFSIENFNNKL